MERQKLVHFAHSRTARVLTPTTVRRRAWTSTTCLREAPGCAPLASIESDVIGGSGNAKKGVTGTGRPSRKIHDSSWIGMRKPVSEGNVCDVDDFPTSPVDLDSSPKGSSSSPSRVHHRVIQRGQQQSAVDIRSSDLDSDFLEDFEPGLDPKRTMRHNSVSGYSDFQKEQLFRNARWVKSSHRLARGPSLTMPADHPYSYRHRLQSGRSPSTPVLPPRSTTTSLNSVHSNQNDPEYRSLPRSERGRLEMQSRSPKGFEHSKSAEDCLDVISTTPLNSVNNISNDHEYRSLPRSERERSELQSRNPKRFEHSKSAEDSLDVVSTGGKSSKGGYIRQLVVSNVDVSSPADVRLTQLPVPTRSGNNTGRVPQPNSPRPNSRLSEKEPSPRRPESFSQGNRSKTPESLSRPNSRLSDKEPSPSGSDILSQTNRSKKSETQSRPNSRLSDKEPSPRRTESFSKGNRFEKLETPSRPNSRLSEKETSPRRPDVQSESNSSTKFETSSRPNSRLSEKEPSPRRTESFSRGNRSTKSETATSEKPSAHSGDQRPDKRHQHTLPEMHELSLTSSESVLETLQTPRSRKPFVDKIDIDILGEIDSQQTPSACMSTPGSKEHQSKISEGSSSRSSSEFKPGSYKHPSNYSQHVRVSPNNKDGAQYLKVPQSEEELTHNSQKDNIVFSGDHRNFRRAYSAQKQASPDFHDSSDCVSGSVDTSRSEDETSSGKENFCDGDEDSNFKPRWKRNSMRLATQGYTSMSDLTNSVDCLNLVTEDSGAESKNDNGDEQDLQKCNFEHRSSSGNSPNLTALSLPSVSPAGEKYESMVDDSATAENAGFRRREGLNKEASPLKRHSFKLATTSLSDLTCDVTEDEEGEEDEERNISKDSANESGTLVSNRVSGEFSCKESSSGRTESDSISSDSGVLVHNSHRKANTSECGSENSSVRKGQLSPLSSPARRHNTSPPQGHSTTSSQGHSSDVSPSSLRSRQSTEMKEEEEEEERVRRIKRNSLRLATSSISDLTCSFDEVDFDDFSPIYHQVLTNDVTPTSRWVENNREPVNVYNTPESHRRDSRGSSFSSGRNSSFGSYYSCQSLESSRSPKASPTNSKGRQNPPLSSSPTRKFGSPAKERGISIHDWRPSSDALSLISDTNESFITARDSESVMSSRYGCEPRKDGTDWQQSHPGSRKSPYTRSNDAMLETEQKNAVSNVHSDRSRSSCDRQKSPKHSKTANTLMNCYGCGFEYGHHVSCQRHDTKGKILGSKRAWNEVPLHSRTTSRINQSSPEDDDVSTKRKLLTSRLEQGRQHRGNFREQTPPYSTSSTHYSRRHPENRYSSRDEYRDAREPSVYSTDDDNASMQSSLYSLTDSEGQWPEMPRSPPSLGRPKRKVYAGFDSQPLPMESFLSDSSSVYTGASCSSRAPSRSADLENSYRGSDWSIDVTGNMRSATSMVAPPYHSAQQRAHDTESITSARQRNSINRSDIISVTDSRRSSRAAQEEVISSTETMADDEEEEAKTPVGFSADKPRFDQYFDPNSSLSSVEEYNGKNNDLLEKALSTPKLPRSLDSLSEKEDKVTEHSDAGALLSLSGISGSFNSDAASDEGKLLYPQAFTGSTLKASSAVSTPRSQLLAKHKYFSSKDIIGLLLTPDKTGTGTAASLTSLEKQAHKVCRAILCCNDMEQVLPGKAYHL